MASSESSFVPNPEQNGFMALSLMNLAGLTDFRFGVQPDIAEAMEFNATKKNKLSRR